MAIETRFFVCYNSFTNIGYRPQITKGITMKKLTVFALLLTTLLVAVACNGESVTTTLADLVTTEATTTAPSTPTTKPEHTVTLNSDLATMKEVVAATSPKEESFDGYTVMTSGKAFTSYANVDFSEYDFMGSGNQLVSTVQDQEHATYGKYARSGKIAYYRVDYNNGEASYTKVDRSILNRLSCLGAKIVVDAKAGYLKVYYQELKFTFQSDYSSVEGGTGSFLRVSFHTSIPMTMKVNISTKSGDTGDGKIKHSNIVPKLQKDGSYVGWGKMTIPYVEPGKYYINFMDNDGRKCYQSIPITITAQEDPRNPDFHLQYSGDWDAITAKGYWDKLTNLFYNTYPRLYARWANGTEPKIITFIADPTYDGVAYAMGTTVTVSTDYANGHPSDIGFFSHEITHSVQQFNFAYGDGHWFTENMANYGGFRYHHWADGNYIQLYKDANQNDLYNWNWGAYGDGSKWFFAYLDAHWPTTVNEDGTVKRGLLDTLVYEIKNGRLKGGDDNPTNKNNMFNKIVKEITGYDCIDDIRKVYAEEFKSKEWDFVGFGNYVDNYLTEDIPYVNNPIYPMVTDKVTGDSAALLDTPVTEGDNLMLGATIIRQSGQTDADQAANLIDGNPDTKWASTIATTRDKTYSLDGTRQWMLFDLGEKKTFNTYTIYNTKSKEANMANVTEWSIMISDDGVNWTLVDYQLDCDEAIASFNVGKQSARYVLFRGYNVDNNKMGNIRLYEFQIYNQ